MLMSKPEMSISVPAQMNIREVKCLSSISSPPLSPGQDEGLQEPLPFSFRPRPGLFMLLFCREIPAEYRWVFDDNVSVFQLSSSPKSQNKVKSP